MVEINDSVLLNKLLEFCDEIGKERELADYVAEDGEIKTFHPLDEEIKLQLENIKKKATNNPLKRTPSPLQY